MKKYFLFLIGVHLLLNSAACQVTQPESSTKNTTSSSLVNYEHPIPFQPKEYVCYKTANTLTIDGQLNEPDWINAPATNNFIDIQGSLQPRPALQTYAKMLWDKEYFYVAAYLEEPHIWATLTERDAVIFYDDDFEVFIDPDGDGHNYYEFEVNAFNTVWDLILLRPYRVDKDPKVLNNWKIKGLQSAVHIEGTLNEPSDQDAYWTVEIAFPWKVLKELSSTSAPPKNGDQWRINFSRVDWTMDIQNNQYTKRLRADGKKPLPEDNWVWSPQGRINMHHPETWGYVQFSHQKAGSTAVPFLADPDEKIKWALWQLHFQQVAYHKKHGRYCSNLAELSPIPLEIPNFEFSPSLEIYTGGYQFLSNGLTEAIWGINEKGKVWRIN